MDAITSSNFSLYSLMITMLFFQKMQLKKLPGNAQGADGWLKLSSLFGSIASMAFLAYFGWYLSWTGALILFVGSIAVAATAGALIERIVGGLALSVLASVVWPLCAYLLFSNAM